MQTAIIPFKECPYGMECKNINKSIYSAYEPKSVINDVTILLNEKDIPSGDNTMVTGDRF